MIIENANNMSRHFKNIFKDEVYKAIEENKEIFTSEVMEKFKVYILTSATIFANKLVRGKRHTVRYGTKQIVDIYDKFIDRDLYVPFRTSVDFGPDEDGKARIYHSSIIINSDELNYLILSNIYRLDTYMERIKLDARHEVGHLIDYLINIEGRSFDEVVKQYDEEDKIKTEYYKWRSEVIDNFDGDSDDDRIGLQREISERYFQLPGEQRADLYGGVDRQQYLDIMESTLKHSPIIKIEVLN